MTGKIQIRRVSFWTRIIGIFSISLGVLGFVSPYPVNIIFLLAAIAAIVLFVSLCRRSRIEDVYLLKALDGVLHYTSQQDPYVGIGDTYQPSSSVNIADIEYIWLGRQHIHRVGTYIAIKLRMIYGTDNFIWFDLEHEDPIIESLIEVCEEGNNIILYCEQSTYLKLLRSRVARLIEGPPPGLDETASTHMSYQDEFTPEEWISLHQLVFQVFRFIAEADHTINSQEVKKLTSYIKGSQGQKSLLFAEILSDIAGDIDEYMDAKIPKPTARVFIDVNAILKVKLDEADIALFKNGVLEFAREIAESDDPDDLASPEENSQLKKLHEYLRA